jgi:dihydroorotase
MIRQAKYLGAPVTCEICPHHLCLSDEDVGEFNVNFKTTPPLRTQVDIDIILQALNDGTIDCIASDHSPYAPYEVDVPFEEAPFGMSSLESTVGVVLTHVTHKGVLTPLETVRKLSTAPAQALNLEAGTLQPGGSPVAQVTLIDPSLQWTYDVNRTFSRGKNSAFHAAPLQGKAVATFCGTEIYRDPLFHDSRYQPRLS